MGISLALFNRQRHGRIHDFVKIGDGDAKNISWASKPEMMKFPLHFSMHL